MAHPHTRPALRGRAAWALRAERTGGLVSGDLATARGDRRDLPKPPLTPRRRGGRHRPTRRSEHPRGLNHTRAGKPRAPSAGREVEFEDGLCGRLQRTAGVDFGDFIVRRRDDLAAYELAVVADAHAMEIAEVVRGADLLTSTARQLLLYEALGWTPPAFAHAPLVCDASGTRLAKRTGGLAIRDLRAAGRSPTDLLTWPVASLGSPATAPRHTS